MSKIIFLKKKLIYFKIKKHFKKKQLSQSQTHNISRAKELIH